MPLDGVDRPCLGDWAVGCRSVETDDLQHADHGRPPVSRVSHLCGQYS